MKIPLPTILSTAWSASQPWPVAITRPPLHYQPLDQMLLLREKQQQQEEEEEVMAVDYILPLSPIDLFEDLKKSHQHQQQDVLGGGVDDDNNNSVIIDNNPFLKTAVGLLYLSRQGFADECHSLVTPLSWAGETLVGYGPPTPGTEAEIVATYAHMLVHRYEGSTLGELSMTGYQNSMFWGKATVTKAARAAASSESTMTQPPYDRIRAEMEELLQLRDYDDDKHSCRISNGMKKKLSPDAIDAGRQWFREWIVSDLPQRGGWEPRALNELCKNLEIGGYERDDPMAEFGAVANQLECDVLIDFCLERAGYDVHRHQQQQQQKVTIPEEEQIINRDVVAAAALFDDDVLRAASHVSSAHISLFQQNGVIVIRNVLLNTDNNNNNEEGDTETQQQQFLLYARAVACRLLGVPACALDPRTPSSSSSPGSDNNNNPPTACVYFITNDNQESVLGFDIGPGDVLVASSDLMIKIPVPAGTIVWKDILVPCKADDKAAVYRDPFFGARGETPTTVIQWSKGTIF